MQDDASVLSTPAVPDPARGPADIPRLDATGRRVLGVLIEKGLTTPEYYPMTVKALVAGCNQKNNRDPLTQLSEEAVTSALRTLQETGLTLNLIAETGRVERWRQELARKFPLDAVDLAIVGELLLRGAQSEGDLRGRAARMRPIETLDVLRARLGSLQEKGFVVRLTPPGVGRGVRYTHTFGPREELDRLRAAESAESPGAAATTPAALVVPQRAAAEARGGSDLAARVAALEERVARLERLSGPPP